MTPDIEKQIVKSYPLVFRPIDPREPIMMFGIECFDGWASIIDSLCQQITNYLESEDGKYFREDFYVTQIKSKLGTLRFHVSRADDKIYALVDQTEQQSERTCEECGMPGSLIVIKGWQWTLCERCANLKR